MWPTPKASSNRNSRQAILDTKGEGKHKSSLALEQAVEVAMGILPRELASISELPPKYQKMWPTPRANASTESIETIRARDARNYGKHKNGLNLTAAARQSIGRDTGNVNPDWQDWLMGWPTKWSALEPLGKDKFQQWLRQFGGC
jgi:hypothetical protein